MASELRSPTRYTVRTFFAFFTLAVVMWLAVALIVGMWFDHDIATGAAAGTAVPIAISGNSAWRDRRLLPRVVLLLIATGIAGGFLGAIIGG